MSLFEFEPERRNVDGGWIYFDPNFLSQEQAQFDFETYLEQLPWQASEITLFGKRHKTPRLEAYFAENEQKYAYSGKQLAINSFTAKLVELKQQVEKQTNMRFNAVLANLYRDGNDANGWHADNEQELGKNPQIASVSFGASRVFKLKHNTTGQTLTYELSAGSLLVMGGELQHHWKHHVPRTKKVKTARINLTFRWITN